MPTSATPNHEQRRRRHNNPSLVQLSIETLARNIEEASTEALECLSGPLLWRVYKYYNHELKSRGENIRVWRLFSSILAKELPRVPTELYWFDWQDDAPTVHDLPRYVQVCTSTSVEFITHLAIHKVWMYRASDLMALAEMPNLGILELSDLSGRTQHEPATDVPVVDSVLNDRLVRGWSEKQKPFPNLRVLLITSVHSSVTLLTLQYAARFPSLVCCGLRSVSLSSREAKGMTEQGGWRVQRTPNLWPDIYGPPGDAWSDLTRDREKRTRPGRWDWHGRDTRTSPAVFESKPHAGVFLYGGTAADQQEHLLDGDNSNIAHALNRDRFPFDMSGWAMYTALGEKIGNADLLAQGVSLPYRATHLERVNGTGPATARHEAVPPRPILNLVLGCPRWNYTDLAGTSHTPGAYLDSLQRRQFSEPGPGSIRMRIHTFVRDYSPTMTKAFKKPVLLTANPSVSAHTRTTKEADSKDNLAKRKKAGQGSTFKPRKRLDLGDLFA